MRYTIGRFAGMHHISKKTLRHYREVGLLLPAGIDPENGYAYYDDLQRERMRRILYLRLLRFSLEDIVALLDADEADWLAIVQRQLAQTRQQRQGLEAVERELRAILTRKRNGMEVYDQMDMAAKFEFKTFALEAPMLIIGLGKRVPYNKPEVKQPMIDSLIDSFFAEDMPALIPHRTVPYVQIGIVGEYDAQTGMGLYMMGELVDRIEEIPEGLRSFTLPVGTYVKITFQAKDKETLVTSALDEAYGKLYSEWLPASGYQEAEMLAVEVYPQETFEVPANPSMEIWTRIVPK